LSPLFARNAAAAILALSSDCDLEQAKLWKDAYETQAYGL